METIGYILAAIGLIIYLIGGIRFLIAEFCTSIWWFIGGLLFPIISFVFLCVHFDEAWPPTKTCLVGIFIIVLGALLPEIRSMNF